MMKPVAPLMVVAAVMFDEQHRVFIARRNPDKSQGGKWEFPGGKVEPGEGHAAALQRELKEELGIDTTVHELIAAHTHRYTHGAIRLWAYHTAYRGGTFRYTDHDAVAWVSLEALTAYDLAEADRPFIPVLLEKFSHRPL